MSNEFVRPDIIQAGDEVIPGEMLRMTFDCPDECCFIISSNGVLGFQVDFIEQIVKFTCQHGESISVALSDLAGEVV